MDPAEYDLDKAEAPAPDVQPPNSRAQRLVAGAVLLGAGAAVWFFFWGRQPPPPPAAEPAPVAEAPAPPATALCATMDAIALPPLEASDALVGTLVGALSTHPRVTAWVATDNLIRNFTVVVENIANGASPAARLRPLRPAGRFRTIERGDGLFVNPRSYDRYAPLAAAVDSVDPQAAARLCGTLKPRLEEAYRELGRDRSFDVALEGAIVALLRAPVLGENVRLAPRGAAYGFEDEALESLTAAQKHLARMGPRHARVIQDKLRQIALAIGIPRERLPQ